MGSALAPAAHSCNGWALLLSLPRSGSFPAQDWTGELPLWCLGWSQESRAERQEKRVVHRVQASGRLSACVWGPSDE